MNASLEKSIMNVRSQIYHLVLNIDPLDELEKSHLNFTLKWLEPDAEISHKKARHS
jgi:hypothetical protein